MQTDAFVIVLKDFMVKQKQMILNVYERLTILLVGYDRSWDEIEGLVCVKAVH